MKRLIPAAIILIFTVSLCVCAHMHVERTCNKTLEDIENYYNQSISADTLEQNWAHHKEQLSLFVNHSFLDKLSIYIGQLTISQNTKNEKFYTTYKNIQTVLSMIKEEQQLSTHSFY